MIQAIAKLAGWRSFIAAACVSAVLAGSGGFSLAWKLQDARLARWRAEAAQDQLDAVKRARASDLAAVALAGDTGAKVEARREAVRTVTRTIIKEVPARVSPAADARCVVPSGFVRLHDAGAAGLPVAPASASQSDDAPSGLELSTVATTVVGNYGACHEAIEALRGWQDFYRGLQASRERIAP